MIGHGADAAVGSELKHGDGTRPVVGYQQEPPAGVQLQVGGLDSTRGTGIEQRQVAGPGVTGKGGHTSTGLSLELDGLVNGVQPPAIGAYHEEGRVAGGGEDPDRADRPVFVTARQDALRFAVNVREALGVGPDDQFLRRGASWR